MSLGRVIHTSAHSFGEEEKGSVLGFYPLPTDFALVTTTTFKYKNSPDRELTHNRTHTNKTNRGAV